ncbi:MGMT family protein [Actinomarinicola tropica]|uniref:MGMT family protein n=1 Tax=Actinomarinicola tropica TaxID=2789776 RepID=UPI00189BEAF8|nr:MGMT family protein [Actinomarinicola tropica]
MTPFHADVQEVLADLGVGEVVSYGEVARRAGRPGAARAVGAFLSAHGGDLPWWRVVRADGWLAAHKVQEQERRLRAEGVDVVAGRVLDALPPR